MKRFNKVLFAVTFLLLVNTMLLQAQKKVPFFVKTSIGASNIKANSGSLISYSLGIETYLSTKEKKRKSFSLNPSLEYLSVGYIPENSSNVLKVRVNYATLALPILYNYDVSGNGTDMFLFFGVGPYIGFATSGKYEGFNNDKVAMKFGDAITDNRKKTDAGLVIKTGFRVEKICISAQYNMGLTNVVPGERTATNPSIKTKNIAVQISFHI